MTDHLFTSSAEALPLFTLTLPKLSHSRDGREKKKRVRRKKMKATFLLMTIGKKIGLFFL
jgi:hypothetical protein